MLVFFGIVMLAVIALWLRAMNRDPGELSAAESACHERRWLVFGGLLLPCASIAALLAIGIPVGKRMLALPEEDALRIVVTAHQWWWQVQYPGRGIEVRNTLHIPVGTPVDVHLNSGGLIHSFWVPRLAGKLDVLPGRTNVLRLRTELPGRYQGQCAEFCGIGHAHMHFEVIAHSQEDFSSWMREAQGDD